jgi:hypothetical protein
MLGSPTRTVSLATSHTHVLVQDDTNDLHPAQITGSEGGYAIPDDKLQDKIEDGDDDWEHDPANPRNWSSAKKWTATMLVSCFPSLRPNYQDY